MKKSLIILIVVILCTCMIAGCFFENKKPAEESAGSVALVSTQGIKNNTSDKTVEGEAVAGEPVATAYITPAEGVAPPDGFEQVTPETDAVIGSLEYPVYSFTDSDGNTMYTAMGQPVDEQGVPCGDPEWQVFVMKAVGTGKSGAKQYVLRDAYDQIGTLPKGAVPAEGDDIPTQMGFTVYSVEKQDAAGSQAKDYYAYADVYDTGSLSVVKSGWQKVAPVIEKIPEDAYSKLIKGQTVYLYDGNGNVKDTYEYGSDTALNPDFSQDTVGVISWDIVIAAHRKAHQAKIKPSEKSKKQEEEKKEEEKKEEEKKEEEKKEEKKEKEKKEETPSRILTLTMKVTAQELQDYLSSGDYDQIILNPGDGADNTLIIDIAMMVPKGTTLTVNAGVPVKVNAGKSLTVNGTADLGDDVTNNGTITVSGDLKLSSGTVKGDLEISGGTLDLSGGSLDGTVSGSGGVVKLNEGTLKGSLTGSFDSIEINGGTFSADLSGAEVTELSVNGGTANSLTPASVGTFTMNGGAVIGRVVLNGVTWVSIDGGSITYSGAEAALKISTDSLDTVYLTGGSVTNNGTGYTLAVGNSGGTLSYDGGTELRSAVADMIFDRVFDDWIAYPDRDGGYILIKEPVFNITVEAAGEHDLDDITATVYVEGEASDTAKQDQEVRVYLYNTGSKDRKLSYEVSETERGNVFRRGNIELAAEAEDTTIEFLMVFADVTITITDTTSKRAAVNNAPAD